jgi:hypothetical protein
MQARCDKDESGREEEEEVTLFDGETTVDVDVDTLSEDAVWQEEELEFEDVEKPGEDKAEYARDGWRSCKSSRRTSGVPVTWGTPNAQSVSVARSKGR